MKRVYQIEQFKNIWEYPKEVLDSVESILKILNENYGSHRNVDTDIGGYVLIAENIDDIENIRTNITRDIIAEYTDEIKCVGGEIYSSSLFLLSSDYSIVVIGSKEFTDILLRE